MTNNKLFEKIVAEVHKYLTPTAIIKEDQRIKGKSGRIRQIDILIEDTAGIYPVKIVIDAKLYKRKIDIKKVEEVWGLIDDVEANMGVIVCNKGYTQGAIDRSKTFGRLKLCSLLDLEHKDFSVGIKIPTTIEMRQPKFSIQLHGASPINRPIHLAPNPLEWQIKENKTGKVETIYNHFRESWNNNNISQEIGNHDYVLSTDKYEMIDEVGTFKMGVNINYFVIARFYFGYTPIKEGKGILDVVQNSLTTKEIVTEQVYFEEVEKSWEYTGLEKLDKK